MFYRYEALKNDKWVGICQAINPSQDRYIKRYLAVPKWYAKNKDTDSRCWFTEEGYQKYKDVMQSVIDGEGGYPPLTVRLLKAGSLNNIAVKGRIQCIQLI